MNKEEGIILIIEDDANLNELIADKVMESGFKYESIMSGELALKWLKTNIPLFMFLDYSLPDYTGTKFIHELAAQHIKVPPFVVATGRGDEMIAVEMMKLGARDYIIKDTSFLDKIGLITKQLSKEIENEKRYIQIENELKEANEFSKQIIEGVKEGIVVYDKQLNYLEWNPYMEMLTGYKSIDIIGKNITESFPNLNKGNHIENIKFAFEDKVNEIIGVEFYLDLPETGKSNWISVATYPMKNSKGKIIAAISTIRNITEQRKAENDLRESENKYRTLIENSPDAIAIYNDGIVTMVNNECLRLMKATSSDQLIGLHVLDFFHPVSKDFVIERINSITTQSTSLEAVEEVFIRLDGSPVDVEVKAMRVDINNQKVIQLIIRDITERKAAQDYLISSKSILKDLVYFSTDLIESSPSKIDYQKFTDKFLALTGAKIAAFNLFEPDGSSFRTIAFSGLADYIETSKKILGFDISNKIWNKDTIREAKLKSNTITKFDSFSDLIGDLVPDPTVSLISQTYNFGEVYVIRITKNDIQEGDFTIAFEKGETLQNPEIAELYANQVGLFIERFKAENNLKESEKKYRVLFADNPQPMFIYDLESLKILEVNQSVVNHYGYSRNEFISMIITDLYLDDERSEVLKLIEETKKGINTDGIYRHIKKNGEEIIVEMNAVSTPSFGKHARHVIINDITLREKAEDNLKTSLSLLNATLESTVDGILVVDSSSDIVTLHNSKFVELWNIPTEVLEQKQKSKVIEYASSLTINAEEFIKRTREVFNYAQKESKDIIELKDGRTFEQVTQPQYIDKRIVGRVISYRDITERIQAEHEIMASIEEMTRFHKLTVGRELVMIELKKEINEFYRKLGEKEKYVIAE